MTCDLTQATLRELIDYCQETGVFTWRKRPSEWFSGNQGQRDKLAARWNTRWAGKPAGSIKPDGYIKIGILGHRFGAHRLALLYSAGVLPIMVDHIDGDPSNNRLSNLRTVSPQGNSQNRRLRSDNTTGTVGVVWLGRIGKWCAQIGVPGGVRHLGVFPSKEKAARARKQAEAELGFHSNHGRTPS